MYILLKSETLQFAKWVASMECTFLLAVGLFSPVLFFVKISNIFSRFKARRNFPGRTSLEPR